MAKPTFSKVLTEPIFKEGTGGLGEAERHFLDEAVEAFRQERIVEFQEHVHRNQWNYFIENTKGIEGIKGMRLPHQRVFQARTTWKKRCT